jgi:uncharacterized protein
VTVFVDTSALYALLDADDAGHDRAVRGTEQMIGEQMLTHTYVLVETVSLIHRRLGAIAAARFIDEVLPAIQIVDVDQALRERALAAFRAATASSVSLVDRTSFELMRAAGLDRAFALDADFADEGFQLIS